MGPMTTIGLSPRLTEKVRGVRSQASLQFVLRTPSAFAFGPTWIGYLVSNVQASLLWTMRSGESYNWSNPGIGSLAVSRARGPIATITDLSVEKVLNARGRFRPSAFLEIRNLFNQMDDTDSGEDYMRWGLQMSPPDSPVYQKYGDETIVTEMPRIRDYKKIAGGHRFAHPPRRWSVGVRVVF